MNETRVRSDDPRGARRWIPIGAVAFVSLAVMAIAYGVLHSRKQVETPVQSAHPVAGDTVPGLILVTPTRVRSVAADDGWMRLGVMSMSAQALAGVAGHAVVPDETTLAAVARVRTRASRSCVRQPAPRS